MPDNDIISKGIKEIYETKGPEAFENARLFHALLNDIAPALTIERKIFRSAIDDSLLKELFLFFDNSTADRQIEAIKIKKKLEDNYGLSEKWSLFIVESFADAACFHINIINSENKQSDVFSSEYSPETTVPVEKTYTSTNTDIKDYFYQRNNIPNYQTKPFVLTNMELFEFDGTVYSACKTSGSLFLKNETRHIGMLLTFDRQPRDTDIEVRWQIFHENGTPFISEQITNSRISSDDTGYYVSWGWPSPGNWPVGKYTAVAKINNSNKLTGSFEIINGSYDQPALKLNGLMLFNGGDIAPASNLRKYENIFQKNLLRRVYFEFSFNATTQNYYTTINYKITSSTGNVTANYAVPVLLRPGNDKCWAGFGWNEPGNWNKGVYRYEVSVGNSQKLYGTFEVN